MPLPLLPLAIIGLTGAAGWQVYKRKGGRMTPERTKLFETAYQTLGDPDKLRELATQFDKQGCKVQGDLLRKRAALREMTPEEKAKNKEVFKAAMQSKNPEAVMKVADIFRKKGALGSAKKLEDYANGLRKAGKAAQKSKATKPPRVAGEESEGSVQEVTPEETPEAAAE